jgi:hypothetical protein
MLSIALYLLLKARDKPRLIQFASLPLAYSFVIRPTNAVPIILLTVYVLLRHRKLFLRVALWSLPVVIPFFIYNLSVYHGLFSPYYLPSKLSGGSTFFEALAGNVVSPARGLFVFSPILAFALYGMVLKRRSGRWEMIDSFLLGALVLHWLVISSFPHWWAGHSYGPRFFTDMMPFFAYFLIPVVPAILRLRKPARLILAACFCLCLLLSFFVHYRGATDRDCHAWNGIPADIDTAPERLWDWGDLQFLRGL